MSGNMQKGRTTQHVGEYALSGKFFATF